MEMKDINISAIQQEWLARKAASPSSSMEDYLLDAYLDVHRDDPGTEAEKKEVFRRRLSQWKRRDQAYQTASGSCPDDPVLEEWQAGEMLNNVIEELEMEPQEEFRYLLNVKFLSACQVTAGAGEDSLRAKLEREYNERWDASVRGVSEEDVQELYGEVVGLMRYTGLGYDDDTRRLLASIGAGKEAAFPAARSAMEEADQRLMADFFVSEMVLSDPDSPITPEEREVLACEAAPVCVAAAAEARRNRVPARSERLAQSFLAAVCTKKNAKILATAALVLVAAKAAVLALEVAAAGAAASVGLKALWQSCKEQQVRPSEALRSLLRGSAAQNAAQDEAAFEMEDALEFETEDALHFEMEAQ